MKTSLVLLVGLAMLATGCSRLSYYAHLGAGGIRLVVGGRSVAALRADPETPPEVRERLDLAVRLLEFAEAELGLPVEKKYRRYIDLERPYVSWTVVATPAFSLEPETWCFPIAGCVSYRGFFAPEKANGFGAKLADEGMDVSVGGVRAFSGLGWLREPLLNTFLFQEEADLAALLFHELAHGAVYVKNGTGFNEAFATLVEREGTRRWLETSSRPDDAYIGKLVLADRVSGLLLDARRGLETLYAEPLEASEMEERKRQAFADLRSDLETVTVGTSLAGWAARELNNADLAAASAYRDLVPAFQSLLEAVNGDFPAFYEAAGCLGEFEPRERARRLEESDWTGCILGRSPTGSPS